MGPRGDELCSRLVVVLGTTHLVHDSTHSRFDASDPVPGVPGPPHLVKKELCLSKDGEVEWILERGERCA